MSSRMERYYKDNKEFKGRSARNASIYQNINDLENYSNIEGVTSIDTTNQIDITKVKEMLKDRESFKNERKYHQAMKDSPIAVERPYAKTIEDGKNYDIMDVKPEDDIANNEPKNYDLRDVISKAKEDSGIKPDKHRSLKNTDYTDLNDLNLRKKEYKDSEEELKELIHTISNNSQLNKLSDNSGLLDELQSDTMVGDASSISKLIEKEKKLDNTITEDLDKSFFGSSFGFSKKDFDDLQGIDKKNHLGLMIFVILFVLLIIAGISYFMFFK